MEDPGDKALWTQRCNVFRREYSASRVDPSSRLITRMHHDISSPKRELPPNVVEDNSRGRAQTTTSTPIFVFGTLLVNDRTGNTSSCLDAMVYLALVKGLWMLFLHFDAKGSCANME